MTSHRPHPHLAIPQAEGNSRSVSPYAFEVEPGANGLPSSWEANYDALDTPLADAGPSNSSMHPHRVRSVFEPGAATMAFPEPQIYRSQSQRSPPSARPSLSPKQGQQHRMSRSDLGLPSRRDSSLLSPASSVSSFYANDDFSSSELTRELSYLSLDSEEGLRRFQAGELPESDEEWHRLVPEEARESLGKQEVQRQSVLFEVFKSERDYVHDLELIKEVFIVPIRTAQPPIIPSERLRGFISEVFWNIDQICAHHQRMLAELFARQRDQHPLVQSVADIILDTILLFGPEYESYIKHYPLAEARHRTELRKNSRYQAFIHSCSQDLRVRKRDLITLISRPVTRLPRLSLVLEHLGKVTDAEHPDVETLPLILNILSDLIKSTQPGIQAAESKVKFWELCESLVYQKGEIIDMDLYDESRTVVYSGPLARRRRSEMDWQGWDDYFVALLDNYLLLTKEEKRPNGMMRRLVASRPIPLEYLRLGSFSEHSENRKEKTDSGRLLESLRFHYRALYPFTVYHASAKSNRRYTLYANTEAVRRKWYDALTEAIAVYKVRQEGNMWFAPQLVNDGFFRTNGTHVGYAYGARFTGRITDATPFISGGRRLIAVGCANGIYVSLRGDPNFVKVLNHPNPAFMVAMHEYNRFIVHYDINLVSYSLDLLARVALGQTDTKLLEASMEKISSQEGSVLFARAGKVGKRAMLIYASRSFLQVTLHALEAVHPTEAKLTRRTSGTPSCFKPFGNPFYVPKDAYDVTPLIKTVAVSTEKGIVIVDPTNLIHSVVTVVPDFSQAASNQPMADLKARCEAAKPLGLLRCDSSELLVIYDTLGCYITKHGAPSRSSGYVRWESQATAYAHHGDHILLFSPQFIEIRNVNTGCLVQVIEGNDIRLLHCGPQEGSGDIILAAMKGDKDDREGTSDKIVDLVETADLTSASAAASSEALWDEWDMA